MSRTASTETKINDTQKQAVAAGVDVNSLPAHVAIIMDGNGRWAKRKGLARLIGHREGYRALRETLLNASELGIKFLTVYAFSAENWKRPEEEVSGLMKLIERAARDELRVMHKNNVRVNVSGRINELPLGLQNALTEGMETTKDNTGITFTLAVNYGGRAEIVDAVKKLVASGISPDEVSEEVISSALYNPGHPEPDLMIRTAGEMRWSNFLLWQGAYCELFVVDKPWPEFGLDDLVNGVASFQRRTRKFGAVVE
jgi:undecaprenyl diphosphate synthase